VVFFLSGRGRGEYLQGCGEMKGEGGGKRSEPSFSSEWKRGGRGGNVGIFCSYPNRGGSREQGRRKKRGREAALKHVILFRRQGMGERAIGQIQAPIDTTTWEGGKKKGKKESAGQISVSHRGREKGGRQSYIS